jgi:hypothetical protein
MGTRHKNEVHPRARRSWENPFPPPSQKLAQWDRRGFLAGPGYFAPDNLPSPSRSGRIKACKLLHGRVLAAVQACTERETPIIQCAMHGGLHRGIPACNHSGSSSCCLPESTGSTSLAYPRMWNVECGPPPFRKTFETQGTNVVSHSYALSGLSR